MKNNVEKGRRYEKAAAEYLENKGYRISEMNFRYGHIDIDIIARDRDRTLVFIEVKYRSDKDYQHPLEAVTPSKQKNISKGALSYMRRNRLSMETPCRFDVIAFADEKPIHIKNAFDFYYRELT